MPPKPDLDWGRAAQILEQTGKLPLEDPERDIPSLFVQDWFKETKREVPLRYCVTAARGLCDAVNDLSARDMLEEGLRRMALPHRERAGVGTAAQEMLQEVAISAGKLKSALTSLRNELIYRRAREGGSIEFEQLHSALHEAFSYGQRRERLYLGGSVSIDEVDAARSGIGPKATLTPTWLEQGCALLIDEVSRQLSEPQSAVARMTSRPVVAMRTSFIQKSASAWFNTTGETPTFRGSEDTRRGILSGFQTFHSFLSGHVAGLFARRAWIVEYSI